MSLKTTDYWGLDLLGFSDVEREFRRALALAAPGAVGAAVLPFLPPPKLDLSAAGGGRDLSRVFWIREDILAWQAAVFDQTGAPYFDPEAIAAMFARNDIRALRPGKE
jgi:hypothetical protein